MEKIIVRDKILERGHANSAYINLCNDKEYNTTIDFLQDYNYKILLNKIYGEEIDCEYLESSKLYYSYLSILETQKDNEYFKVLFRLDDEFAVHLSGNIHLYHFIPKNGEVYTSLIPWFYADSKKYLGDTWWEKDFEIINDLKTLSIVDFYKKYKGY